MMGRALLLDDNPTDLRVVSRVLERAGFGCDVFTNHAEALEFINSNSPQLIFLDLQMPMKSGYDLIQIFKSHSNTSTTPIIIISGKNRADDVKKAVQLGANDYIIKPLDPLVLLEKIRKIKENSPLEYTGIAIPPDQFKGIHFCTNLKLIALSEFGVQVESQENFSPGETAELASLPKELFGSERAFVRCLSSDFLESTNVYLIQFTFVGLGEAQRQSIRKYCQHLYIKNKRSIA